jgi:hypothetical protein
MAGRRMILNFMSSGMRPPKLITRIALSPSVPCGLLTWSILQVQIGAPNNTRLSVMRYYQSAFCTMDIFPPGESA